MNKNLLRVIAFGAYLLISNGLIQLINWIVPIQPHEFFTTTGIVRTVIFCLIITLGGYAFQLILRKYGAQLTPITPLREIIILLLALIVITSLFFFIILFQPF